MGPGRTKRTTLLAILAVAFGGGPALAQSSGTTGSFQFSTVADFDSNRGLVSPSPGSEFRLSETLKFDLTTETRTQTLSLTGSGTAAYDAPATGSATFDFVNPQVALSYTRDAANAALTADADYWSGTVTTAFDIDPSPGVVLVVDDGLLTRTGFDVGLQTGLQAPLTLSFGAGYDDRSYTDTADPNLFNDTTTSVSATADMRISPVMQGRLAASYSDYQAADAASTSTQTGNVDFTLSHELRRALTLDANVGFQQRDTTAVGAQPSRSGIRAGLNARQALPRGSMFAGVQWDATGTTERTSLTFGRDVTLPTGSLSASVQAVETSGTGLSLLGNASYNRKLADTSIDLSVTQSIATNQLDQDVLNTRLGLAYAKQVNSMSDVRMALNMTRSEDGGTVGTTVAPTLNRATLTASYDRELNPDWDFTVGYRYRFYSSDSATTPGTSANSNAIFLNLTKNVDFGF